MGGPNKQNNIAVFDNLNVRENPVDFQGMNYPRDSFSIDYASNDYLDQMRDLKLFYKGYVGEKLLILFIIYTDMISKYPIQVIDLRFQVDHMDPKNFNYLKNIEAQQLMLDCFW